MGGERWAVISRLFILLLCKSLNPPTFLRTMYMNVGVTLAGIKDFGSCPTAGS